MTRLECLFSFINIDDVFATFINMSPTITVVVMVQLHLHVFLYLLINTQLKKANIYLFTIQSHVICGSQAVSQNHSK